MNKFVGKLLAWLVIAAFVLALLWVCLRLVLGIWGLVA